MTEQQKYTLIQKIGHVEIRDYEACVLADVFIGGQPDGAASRGFGHLFQYIAGSNESQQKIAMTAPVIQDSLEKSWRISFVLPADAHIDTVPMPTDAAVHLRQVPQQFAAALSFRGNTNQQRIVQYEKTLRSELARHNIAAVGELRWARFDPPFKPPFLRHNEVILTVQWPPAN